MANHVRRQIREAVEAALGALATTGANVFATRVYHAERSKLPCLLVYTTRERSTRDGITRPRPLMRELEVSVEALVRTTAGADDQIDQICKEVEAALGNSTLGGLVKDLWLSGTDVSFSGQGEKKVTSARMTWTATYRTSETAADSTV